MSLTVPIALCNGAPVSLSQAMVVSLWLVIPTAVIKNNCVTTIYIIINYYMPLYKILPDLNNLPLIFLGSMLRSFNFSVTFSIQSFTVDRISHGSCSTHLKDIKRFIQKGWQVR